MGDHYNLAGNHMVLPLCSTNSLSSSIIISEELQTVESEG